MQFDDDGSVFVLIATDKFQPHRRVVDVVEIVMVQADQETARQVIVKCIADTSNPRSELRFHFLQIPDDVSRSNSELVSFAKRE